MIWRSSPLKMTSPSRATRTVIVGNPEGLHARVATRIAGLIRQYRARVEVIKDCRRVDGTEVLELLSLCALPDDRLLLEATGQDADAALDAVVRLFAGNFNDEEPPEKREPQANEAHRPEIAPDGDRTTE